MADKRKVDLSKVRYAAIVAIIGLAVALVPGLTETAQEWIRILSVVIGGQLVETPDGRLLMQIDGQRRQLRITAK